MDDDHHDTCPVSPGYTPLRYNPPPDISNYNTPEKIVVKLFMLINRYFANIIYKISYSLFIAEPSVVIFSLDLRDCITSMLRSFPGYKKRSIN